MNAGASGLELIVEFNEAAKAMESRACEVRVHALDALVRSARDRSLTLAGFREVSSQMRSWADDLTLLVERLRKACASAVSAECVAQTLVRRRRLVQMARCHEADARILQREEATRARRRTELLALRETLDELRQLGLMATALSRTAMIEATAASGDDRTVLMLAAREFGERAAQVLDCGRALQRSTREAA
ncbi:MAG: hypothetical protein QM817_30675 [Archangium sp.]